MNIHLFGKSMKYTTLFRHFVLKLADTLNQFEAWSALN